MLQTSTARIRQPEGGGLLKASITARTELHAVFASEEVSYPNSYYTRHNSELA